jgi:hypothetical protein
LLSPYDLTYQEEQSDRTGTFAGRGSYFPIDKESNSRHLLSGDNGLRQIYFFIIKYDEQGNPITADSLVGKRYRVYCVTPGQYLNFKLHNKDLSIISTSGCQDYASVSSKNLAGSVYYFFAVSFDGEIVSKEERWNVGSITKSTTDLDHPYSYVLQVSK